MLNRTTKLLAGILVMFALASLQHIGAQAGDYHRMGLFWGSVRAPYSALMSGLEYRSAAFADKTLRFDARLQSFGSWYIVSPSSFDLEAALLLNTMNEQVSFSGGAGYKLFARLYVDERSTATTKYAPFMRADFQAALLQGGVDLDFRAVFDVGFFNDGFSLHLRPELLLGVDWFYASLQLEGGVLVRNDWGRTSRSDSELRMDSFLGLGVRMY